jgi:nucleotide-binding universal stress UspA family protein
MTTTDNGAGRRPLIVAGYAGSPPGRAAVSLAARRAGRAGHLIVVHAYEVPADWLGWPDFQPVLTAALNHGETLMADLPEEVPEINQVDWEPEIVQGRPSDVIARVADVRHADEIVVGSRGFGRARALLGSVAHELIHQAGQPVTIIPRSALERAEAEAHPGARAAPA